MGRLTAPVQNYQGDKDADKKPCQYTGKACPITMS